MENKKVFKNSIYQNQVLHLHPLKNTKSNICCHAKPSKKEIEHFQNIYQINYVLTLFNPKENPQEIGKLCKLEGIGWEWWELNGANFLKKTETANIISKLVNLAKMLTDNKINLFVHCAAGLHRTGAIVYTILRMFGESKKLALMHLEKIRKETRKKVGDHRIEYAERLLVQKLPVEFEQAKKTDELKN